MPCGLLWGHHVQEGGLVGSTELGGPLEAGWGSHNCSLGGARGEADGVPRAGVDGGARGEAGAGPGDESLHGGRSCGWWAGAR